MKGWGWVRKGVGLHPQNQTIKCSAKHLPLLIPAPTVDFPFLEELPKIVSLLWCLFFRPFFSSPDLVLIWFELLSFHES